MSMLLYRLGGFIDRTRVWVVAAWLLLLTAVIGTASMLGTHYDDSFSIPGTQSQQGQEVLADRFGLTGTNGQIFYTTVGSALVVLLVWGTLGYLAAAAVVKRRRIRHPIVVGGLSAA